jgi:hypothetical protein
VALDELAALLNPALIERQLGVADVPQAAYDTALVMPSDYANGKRSAAATAILE